MNKNKLYNVLSAGFMTVLLITGNGCTGNEVSLPPTEDDNRMTFNVMHPHQAVASSRATSTAFENGDRVGLFITRQDTPLEVSGNYVNNAALTFNGSQWNTEKPVYWDGGTYNIYAYYPQVTPVTSVDNMPFSVSTNQNSSGDTDELSGYEASDFLWAIKQNASASNTAVSLQFSHRMSRMLIRLVKGEDYEGDELPDDVEVYIHSTVPSATIDMNVGIVTRNPYGTAQTIRAKDLGNQMYAAIIVPQRLDNRQPLVEVIMKGVSYLYESKFQFKPGIQHSVQLAISKDPGQIKIEIGGEMEDWSETEE